MVLQNVIILDTCSTIMGEEAMDLFNFCRKVLYWNQVFTVLLNMPLIVSTILLEFSRLNFIAMHQKHIRADKYKSLEETVAKDKNLRNIGRKKNLLASFTRGGSRAHY